MRATLLLLVAAVFAWGAWIWRATPVSPASRPHTGHTAPASLRPPSRDAAGHWRLKFDDEFNGDTVDLSKWQPNWLGAGPYAITTPVTSYDLNCISPTQATEAHGVLALTSVAQPCITASGRGYGYASGLVNTKHTFTFTYGYLAARIKVPTSPSGRPVDYPAFWANGLGHWPSAGELDVMEVLSGCGPGVAFHFHNATETPGACGPHADASAWHVFAADWEPGAITFYYDGRRLGQVRRGITHEPMYLVLDNSVNPLYGGPLQVPSRMLVDYVRVWHWTPAHPQP